MVILLATLVFLSFGIDSAQANGLVAIVFSGQLRAFDTLEAQRNMYDFVHKSQTLAVLHFLCTDTQPTDLLLPFSSILVEKRRDQFDRRAACFQHVKAFETRWSLHFDWFISLRPDHVFYQPVPDVLVLSEAFVHARVRCSAHEEWLSEDQLSQWGGTFTGCCSRPFAALPELKTRIYDDTLAAIPAGLAEAYFGFTTQTAIDANNIMTWPETELSVRLHNHGVKVSPLTLRSRMRSMQTLPSTYMPQTFFCATRTQDVDKRSCDLNKGLIPGCRVAACMSGQLRTLATQSVQDNIWSRILEPLGADLFMFVSSHNKFMEKPEGELHMGRFDSETRSEDVAAIKERFHPAAFVVDAPLPQHQPSFCLYRAEEKYWGHWTHFFPLFHGVHECYALVAEHERQTSQKYDAVIRLRPDVVYDVDIPWHSLALDRVHYHYDIFAVVPRNYGDVFFNDVYRMFFNNSCVVADMPLNARHCPGKPLWSSECFYTTLLLRSNTPHSGWHLDYGIHPVRP